MSQPYDWKDQEEVDFEFFRMIHENFHMQGESIHPRPSRWQRLKRCLGQAMYQYSTGAS